MNAEVAELRRKLTAIEPCPEGAYSFQGRPLMTGTAFFPGGDGLWKSDRRVAPALPAGGVLFLGSDFGDVYSYQHKFRDDESDGATWRGLRKLLHLAEIRYEQIFCTNAWPCLRAGASAIKGGVPASRDREFTQRCEVFFSATLDLMRPRLVVPLGLKPTAFLSFLGPGGPWPWGRANSWQIIDETPIWRREDFTVVPIVHPSMPNRRHRKHANTIDAEAELIRSALAGR